LNDEFESGVAARFRDLVDRFATATRFRPGRVLPMITAISINY